MSTSRLRHARKASRAQLKARVALDGPTGAGKTYSSLEWAMNLQTSLGRTVVIDTEGGSAEWYSDRWDYEVVPWAPPYHPGELADTIREAQSQYDVVIVDSISHFWEGEGGTLDMVDNAAQRANGNSYAGWKVGTPALRRLVDTILQSTCHIVVTMRSKMEYVLEKDPKTGRQAPKKIGMSPVMRAGIEYEFTLIGDLDLEHRLTITKSRASVLDNQVFQAGQAGEAAQTFLTWLNDGESVESAASEYVKIALDPASTADDLAIAYRTAEQRRLLNASVTDETGQARELGELLMQRGQAARAAEAQKQTNSDTPQTDGAEAATSPNGGAEEPTASATSTDGEAAVSPVTDQEPQDSGGETALPSTNGTASDESPAEPAKMTEKTRRKLFALFTKNGIKDKEVQLKGISEVIGREITSRGDLTEDEALRCVEILEARQNQPEPAGVAS